jgi:hypothetical protein
MKIKEAARAGSEEAVIKTDGGADAGRQQALRHAAVHRRMHGAEILFLERVDGNRQQDQRQQAAHEIARHAGDGPGAHESQREGGDRGRRRRAPCDLHAARIFHRRHRGAAHRRQFVCPQQRRRYFLGEDGEDGRDLNQSSPSNHSIDQTGKKGRAGQDDEIKHGNKCDRKESAIVR